MEDGLIVDKLGRALQGTKSVLKADESPESLQGYGIHICHFQENTTFPVHTAGW